jgi:two-component system, OmpR family, sensor histidine kinase MprB
VSLRVKLVAALVSLSALTAVLLGVLSYRVTSGEMRRAIDRSLVDAEREIAGVPQRRPDRPRRGNGIGREFERVLVQIIGPDGEIVNTPFSGDLPVDEVDRAVAAGQRDVVTRDVGIDGEPFRMRTRAVDGGAVQLARSLAEVEQISRQIRRRTLWIGALVAAAAGLVGWLLASQLTQRLRRLTRAAGDVATTGNLHVDVPAEGDDEAGQLGRAFSGMLGTLAQSQASQRQLVQDAGHELRTPLTSLRTNVSVLRRHPDLPGAERAAVLADIDTEAKELTELVNELVELATEQRSDEPLQRVALADVAERVAERARRRSGRDIQVVADGTLVDAPLGGLERAIGNLLDNAAKFAPSGPIEVTVRRGALEVRDHGTGFAAGDEQRVFGRFYRADTSRSLPGSGLGLSIVQSVVERCGGVVFARNAASEAPDAAAPESPPSGGAIVGFTLPDRQ